MPFGFVAPCKPEHALRVVVHQSLMPFEFVAPCRPGRALRVVAHPGWAFAGVRAHMSRLWASLGQRLHMGSTGESLILDVPAAETSSHSWGTVGTFIRSGILIGHARNGGKTKGKKGGVDKIEV